MTSLKKDLIVALKGFGMGAANVIPGVSGGTIALITGIFGRIVDSLNMFTEPRVWKDLFKGHFREFWKAIDGRFLVALGIGVLVSVFSLAKLMEYVLSYYPIQTWAFFFGMIAASAIVMLAGVKDWKLTDVLWAIFGGILGIVICTLSPTKTPDDMWFIFICAVLAICTMILPGVSGSFVLLILGKYEYIMSAVNDLNWPVLIVFALGCAIGILAFSKLLHWLLKRYERQTMLVLVGFVLGSLVKVWPWSNPAAIVRSQLLHTGMEEDAATLAVETLEATGTPLKTMIENYHIPSAIIWAILGVALVALLEWLGHKSESAKE